MTLNTATDIQNLVNGSDFRVVVYVGANIELYGHKVTEYEQRADINTRRLKLRFVASDVASISVGTTLRVDGTHYTVREREVGDRFTALILEVIK